MSADGFVLSACLIAVAIAAGIEVGRQQAPMVCPSVAGQEVVRTVASQDGRICVYASSYGRALRKVRL